MPHSRSHAPRGAGVPRRTPPGKVGMTLPWGAGQGGQWQQGAVGQWKTRQGGQQGAVAPRSAPGVPNALAMGFPQPPGLQGGSDGRWMPDLSTFRTDEYRQPTGRGGVPPGLLNSNASNQARQNFGLPLDALYEGGRRSLEDRLQMILARISGMRPQIQAQGRLGLERLGTNQGREQEALDEGLIGRGIYRSGIRNRDTNVLRNLYERRRQDLSFGEAQQLGGLAGEEGEARLNYGQGLNELMLQLAARQSQLGPYSAAPRR